MKLHPTIEILLADDDAEDRMLIIDALKEGRLKNRIREVDNGEELMLYLNNKGQYNNKSDFQTPGLILLDLNMPKKDGREALREIKADKNLRSIPIIILTTSKADEDILKSYDLGVNSFITKPVIFSAMVEVMTTLNKYWFEIVALPGDSN
jgi:CheY-like chemotaxis protein